MATRVSDQIAWVAGLVGIASTVAVQSGAMQEANTHSKLKQDGSTTRAIRALVASHFIASAWFPLAVLVGVPATRMVGLPKYLAHGRMSMTRLPTGAIELIRGLGCVAMVVLPWALREVHRALSTNMSVFGLREKHFIVSSGPFGVVRHPLYSLISLFTTAFGLAFYNKYGLYSAALTAGLFVIKIPAEEQVILKDATLGDEYRQYQAKVPYRLIPGVW